MDSLTQIVLGAATAEAVLGKKVGNKAILWGAVAGTIPDLDVIANWFMDPIHAMAAHRGFTHSITFSLIFAPLMGYGLYRFYKWRGKEEASFWGWTLMAFVALFTHPLLDCFTTWGTQLFWPFSDYRVAIQSIFVVDPLYTLPFLTFVILAMTRRRDNPWRQRFNWAGIALSTLYLGITLVNQNHVNTVLEETLVAREIEYKRYETKPAPLQNILWVVNAEVEEGFYTGEYSLFDKQRSIDLTYYPKNHQLLSQFPEDDRLDIIKWVANDYFIVRDETADIVLHDIRFGRMVDFSTGEGDFVMGYHLSQKEGELHIEQSRAPAEEGVDMGKVFEALIQRIKGI